MCNCAELPPTIACHIEYWHRDFDFQGVPGCPAYFQELDTDTIVPSLDYDCTLYVCGSCKQGWYIECLPEETPSPSFAMKLKDSSESPSAAEIEAEKQSLSVLAHCGFEPEKCMKSACQNLRLKGRSLCHLHITFL